MNNNESFAPFTNLQQRRNEETLEETARKFHGNDVPASTIRDSEPRWRSFQDLSAAFQKSMLARFLDHRLRQSSNEIVALTEYRVFVTLHRSVLFPPNANANYSTCRINYRDD